MVVGSDIYVFSEKNSLFSHLSKIFSKSLEWIPTETKHIDCWFVLKINLKQIETKLQEENILRAFIFGYG